METNASTTQVSFWAKNKKAIITVVVILAVIAFVYFVIIKPKMDANKKQESKDDAEEKPKVNNLIGKKVTPAAPSGGAEAAPVIIRSAPEVNEKNIMGKVEHPNEVGRILSLQVNKNDKKIWYRVRLPKPINGKNEGWVREDGVMIETSQKA